MHQASGWAWSCAVLRGRMTARLALGATSAVGLSMASWCAQAGSPTAVLMEPSWWTKAAETTDYYLFFPPFSCLSAVLCSYSSLVNKQLDGWRDNMLPEDETKHFVSTKDRVISQQFSLRNGIYCVFGFWMMFTAQLSSVSCFLARECSPCKWGQLFKLYSIKLLLSEFSYLMICDFCFVLGVFSLRGKYFIWFGRWIAEQ